MNEKQGIHEADGKRDNFVVVVIAILNDSYAVKKPKTERQHEDEK